MSNTKTYPPVSATSEDLFSQRPEWLLNSHDRDIGEYWIDELQEARAKDAELIQMLVDCIRHNYHLDPFDTIKSAKYYALGGKTQHDALNAAAAAGFKPTEP